MRAHFYIFPISRCLVIVSAMLCGSLSARLLAADRTDSDTKPGVLEADRKAEDSVEPEWWSLKPLTRPSPPTLGPAAAAWVRTPIDRFILAKIEERGLEPSPEADRRVLIRRLFFDLIGLPPDPDTVEWFVQDPDPEAYEGLVDSLLGSPRYGERWARHWLDVVHYGDTHGYDKDKLRPNAWPYRDYVIRALNQDRRYGLFIREQVAGDVLYPGNPSAIEATGFIAAGPWDFIGHAEVPESKYDGKVARHLDRDDMVSTTMNTFVSTTVQCAQCHRHKFDPISQEEYYGLQAVFAALDRADREYDRDPETALRRAELKRREADLVQSVASLEAKVLDLGGEPLRLMTRRIAELREADQGADRPEFGFHSQIEPRDDVEKWVQVDLGESVPIDRIGLAGCRDNFNGIGAGFGFPVRFRVETAADPAFTRDRRVVADFSGADYRNPGVEPVWLEAGGVSGRFVRVTATKLTLRADDYIFALAELIVEDGQGRNIARDRAVKALDSIEAGPRWARGNLVDGVYPGPRHGGELARLERERDERIEREVDSETRLKLAEARNDLRAVRELIAALPPRAKVYAGTVHHGSGNFRGTGPDGGEPRTVRVLRRGNVLTPAAEAQPGALRAVEGLPARFELDPDDGEGARRIQLAEWLSSEANPLTWRSIVNRVWLYHFGRGIVDSPNDFGRMGQLPTHPELLDWLAVEFRDGGQSLKRLHRLIVTSAVYRQSSESAPDRDRLDGGNLYLSRMNRRRLTAEEIRDSVLVLAGKLNLEMYGPGFRDFVIEKPEHSPHYQYDLHDPNDPESQRRSVYRFIVRSQQQPFMTTLDCADPSMLVAKRDQTQTSLQALSLLNNQFMVAMAVHFGDRMAGVAGAIEEQVRWAFRAATGREPDDLETGALAAFIREHGHANAARVLLNLNEFVFVD